MTYDEQYREAVSLGAAIRRLRNQARALPLDAMQERLTLSIKVMELSDKLEALCKAMQPSQPQP